MAKQRYHIILFTLLCLQICYSIPLPNQQSPLGIFVIEDEKDCRLAENPNATKLVKLDRCPKFIEPFSENYFVQRDILPCLGIYDALYHLCKFPVKDINFNDTFNFKEPGQFCSTAKDIFHNLNFTYKRNDIKNWTNALRKHMQDEKRCNNLCVADSEINEQCVTMLILSNEYLRLNMTHNEKIKANKTSAEQVINDVTLSKNIAEGLAKVPENNKLPISGPVSTSAKDVVSTSNANFNQNPALPLDEELKKTKTSKDEISPINVAALSVDAPPNNVPKEGSTSKTTNTPNNTNSPLKTSPINSPVAAVKMTQLPKAPEVLPPTNIQKVPPPNTVEDDMFSDETSTSQADEMVGNSAPPEENNEGLMPNQKGKEDEETERQSEEKKPPVDTDPLPKIYPEMPIHPIKTNYDESEESYSFTFIVTTMAGVCMAYMLFHYRNKLLALALEGRKGRNGRSRGRPSSANYTKLHHSNLEEAIASSVTAPTATHVLY